MPFKKHLFPYVCLILFLSLSAPLSAAKKPIVTLTPQKKKEIKSLVPILHTKGHESIQGFLGPESSAVFEEEALFIDTFPFKNYPLYRVENQGFFFVNDVNDTIKNVLRKGRAWEPGNRDLIKKYVVPGTVALDIGAHVGTHTVTMSESVGKEGLVFAFEPSLTTYRELVHNLAANRCHNALPIRSAVGKDSSFVDVIVSHPRNEGGKYVIESKGGSDSALQIPLDDLELENISFIKIDVENMEADVLEGAKLTLQRCRPVILIEIQGNGERPVQLGEDTKEMAKISKEKLKSLGYKLKFIHGADYLAFPVESLEEP